MYCKGLYPSRCGELQVVRWQISCYLEVMCVLQQSVF